MLLQVILQLLLFITSFYQYLNKQVLSLSHLLVTPSVYQNNVYFDRGTSIPY
jgi:hypothetical protein